jgi:hypothetical protein
MVVQRVAGGDIGRPEFLVTRSFSLYFDKSTMQVVGKSAVPVRAGCQAAGGSAHTVTSVVHTVTSVHTDTSEISQPPWVVNNDE